MSCLPPVPHAMKGRLLQAVGLQGFAWECVFVVTNLKAIVPHAVSVQHANGEQDAQRQASPHAEVCTPQGQHQSEGEAKEQPAWLQVAVLLFCWGVVVMFTLLLSHYPRCSGRYWAIFGVQGAACLAAEALFIHLVSIRPCCCWQASLSVAHGRQLMSCSCIASRNAAKQDEMPCMSMPMNNLEALGHAEKGPGSGFLHRAPYTYWQCSGAQ